MSQPQPPTVPGPPAGTPPPYARPVPPQPYGPPTGGWVPQPPRPKKPFWTSTGGVLTIIGIVLAGVMVLCVGAAVFGLAADRNAASKMKVSITSCKFEGADFLPSATVGYTVTNTGDSARSATIKIEYRDSSGARIDTDTARVSRIAPGDTVRGEEITMLDAPVTGGTCKVVGVS